MSIKIVFLVGCAALLSYAAYEVARINALVITSRSIVTNTEIFTRPSGDKQMLVLGDSIAAGVGTEPEHSLAARLSEYLDASAENLARSGAKTDDVLGQLKQVQRDSYDLIFIAVGANDVIRFRSLWKAVESLRALLEEARALSPRVVLLTAGRIGDAPLFPLLVRPLMNMRAAALRERFIGVATEFDVAYVDLFTHDNPFKEDMGKYYSPDLLHLTGEGYAHWFGIVREYVEKKWPELVVAK